MGGLRAEASYLFLPGSSLALYANLSDYFTNVDS